MRLFRRVPTPFAITYLVSSLLRESVQKRKADKYAAQAVHYYKKRPPVSPAGNSVLYFSSVPYPPQCNCAHIPVADWK